MTEGWSTILGIYDSAVDSIVYESIEHNFHFLLDEDNHLTPKEGEETLDVGFEGNTYTVSRQRLGADVRRRARRQYD